MQKVPISGERIRGMRNAVGWSRQRLAAEVGCSTAAVSRWESDGTVPDAEHLAARAAALDVEPTDLEPTHSDPTVDYIRGALFHAAPLPDDALDVVAHVIRRTSIGRRLATESPAA